MLGIFAFLGQSDDPWLGLLFMIPFLLVGLMVAGIIWLIFLVCWSFYRRLTGAESQRNLASYVVAAGGVAVVLGNIGGSKYVDDRLWVVLDSVLLASAFLLGTLSASRRFTVRQSTLLIILAFASGVVFLAHHYSR